MKVFIIAAQTKDGFIAKDDSQNSMDWTSGADKQFFIKKTKEAGVVVMGRKTFETIGKPLSERRNIILSRNKELNLGYEKEKVEITNERPKELLDRLKLEGVSQVAILGGSSIYTTFLEEGLVDKAYITVEPVEFGEGIKLFGNSDVEKKMNLLSTIELGQGALLLEYEINN